MLDVKQQKVFQENMSLNKSDITDFTGLEVSIAYVFFQVAVSEICLYSKYIKKIHCLLHIPVFDRRRHQALFHKL